MNRKDFLKSSCAFCGIGVVAATAFLESCQKSNTDSTPQGPTVNFTLDLSQSSNAALNNTGGSLSTHGVIVVNTGSTYIAIAQSCTHAGCSVNYNPNGHNFICPCHGGTFDTSGNVTSGPPPAPLKSYTVSKNGTILTIAG